MNKIFKCLVLLSCLMASTLFRYTSAKITIVEGTYGYPGNFLGLGSKHYDLKGYFENQAKEGYIGVLADMNAEDGNPSPNHKKETNIKWQDNGKKLKVKVPEGKAFYYESETIRQEEREAEALYNDNKRKLNSKNHNIKL